jgi:flagellar hook-length control protein FliK
MVDISAVLDSAGAGLAATGKKGGKEALSGAGESGAQAGFIAVLMAQANGDGAARGLVPEWSALVAEGASAAKPLPMGHQPGAAGPDLVEAWQAGSMPGFASMQGRTESPAGLVAGSVPAQGFRPAGQASLLPVGQADPALAEAVSGVQSTLPDQAELALVGQAEEGAPDAGVVAQVIDAQAALVGVPGLSQALVVAQGGQSKAASLGGDPDVPGEPRGGDRLIRMLAAGDAREAATSAPVGGNVARDLPSASPVGGEGMRNIELPTELLAAESSAGASVPSLPAPQGPAQDPSVLRPFDHTLRQVEARLNLSVEAPVRSPAFAQELGEKVVWLAGRQGQVAEMVLNPPQLGTLEVRLTLSGSEAGAQFYSANPVVRETIESALPRLRDMMAQAGINLGEANVRDQSFQQGARAENAGQRGVILPGVVEESAEGGLVLATLRSQGRGLVDLYA